MNTLNYKTIIGISTGEEINYIYCYFDYSSIKESASLLRSLRKYYNSPETRKFLLGNDNIGQVRHIKEDLMPINKERKTPSALPYVALLGLAWENDITAICIYDNAWRVIPLPTQKRSN